MSETLTSSRRGDPTTAPPSLVSLVGIGKDVEQIGQILGLPNEEVRARLQKTGLLTIVEPPEAGVAEPAPAPTAPPLPAKEPTPMQTQPAAVAPTNGAPVPTTTKKKRGPKPKVAVAVATPAPTPAAKPAKTKRGGGRPTNVELASRREAADRVKGERTRLAYGTLYLAAMKSGVPVDELVAAARIISND